MLEDMLVQIDSKLNKLLEKAGVVSSPIEPAKEEQIFVQRRVSPASVFHYMNEGDIYDTKMSPYSDHWLKEQDGRFWFSFNVPSGAKGLVNAFETCIYEFNVPKTAVIKGITAQIYRACSCNLPDYCHDVDVRLKCTNAANYKEVYTSNFAKQNVPWQGKFNAIECATYGGPNDLWGRAWTADEINQPNFAFRYQFQIQELTAYKNLAGIDAIALEVAYSMP